jgi:hypothetical protein
VGVDGSADDSEEREEEPHTGREEERKRPKKDKGRCVNSRSQLAIKNYLI